MSTNFPYRLQLEENIPWVLNLFPVEYLFDTSVAVFTYIALECCKCCESSKEIRNALKEELEKSRRRVLETRL